MALQTGKFHLKTGGKQTPLVKAGGVKQLALSIRRMEDKELSAEMRKVSKAAAERVVPFAKARTPVGTTGNLRKSIKATATRSQGRIQAGNKRTGKAGVSYSRAVHSGKYFKSTGRRTKGQPFIKDAIPKAWPGIVREYTEGMNRIADAFNAKHGAHRVKGRFKG